MEELRLLTRPRRRPKDAGRPAGRPLGATELLAGGTDLLDLQKEYVAQPDKVISLSGPGQGVPRDQGGSSPGTQPMARGRSAPA